MPEKIISIYTKSGIGWKTKNLKIKIRKLEIVFTWITK